MSYGIIRDSSDKISEVSQMSAVCFARTLKR